MHELLLHASVPEKRHDQILSILAGLTATPTPPRIFERHYIYRPARGTEAKTAAQVRGASQVIDERKVRKPGQAAAGARFVTVVETLSAGTGREIEEGLKADDSDEVAKTPPRSQMDGADDGDGNGIEDDDAMQDVETSATGNGLSSPATTLSSTGMVDGQDSETIWMLHDAEYPEPGIRSHVARRNHSRSFPSSNAVSEWAAREDMTLVASFLVLGHQFVSSHVLLRLFQVVVLTSKESTADESSSQASTAWDAPLEAYDKDLLDDNKGSVLEASVTIEEGEDASVMRQAEGELMRVKKELDGVIELRAADRNSMDTRVR